VPRLRSDHIPIGAIGSGVKCNIGGGETVANHERDVGDNPDGEQHAIYDSIQIRFWYDFHAMNRRLVPRIVLLDATSLDAASLLAGDDPT
jgi:hypothetical protein